MENKNWIKTVVKVVVVLVILVVLGFISPLTASHYDIHSSTLPTQFNGYKIVQISDFHCKKFGNNEDKLIRRIEREHPDLIVLTGDIVDEEHPIDNAKYLLEGLKDVAPMYYVTGNHEYYPGAPLYEFKELCAETGVTILNNERTEIQKDGATIRLTGLDWEKSNHALKDYLGYADPKYFNIMLYHDASKFNFLSEYGYDLVFTGHIHGGLIRIPFKGGVFGTDYLMFPQYTKGVYHDKSSTMVCSAGLGDARIPRWNNPREIVVVKLHSDLVK